MKKFKFFAIALSALFTLGLTSCNKDYDEDIAGKYVEITLLDGESITICDSTCTNPLDTTGIAGYPLYFTVTLNDGNLVVKGLQHATCQKPGLPSNPQPTSAYIKSMGKVKGLIKIEDRPDATDTLVSAEAEHGYVVKAFGTSKFTESYGQNFHICDPDDLYMRIWLKEEDGNGYVVRYQTRY